MVRYESGCINCGLPCIRSACPYYSVLVKECDCCHEETDKLYYYGGDDIVNEILYGGQELCEECFLKHFELVDEDNEIYLYEGKEIEKYDLLEMFEARVED